MEKKSQKEVYFRLFRYTFPYKGYGAVAVFGYVLFALSQPAFAALMKMFVDALQGEYIDNLFLVPAAAVVIALFRGVGAYLGSFYIAKVGQSVIHDLRCELFDKLMRLPLSYFDQNKDGHIVSRLTFIVNNVANAVTNAVTVVAREGFTVIGLLAYMVWVSPSLTAVMLIVVPFAVILVRWVSKAIRSAGVGVQDAMGEVNHSVAEAARGIRLLKAYNAAETASANFEHVSGLARKIGLRIVRLSSIYSPVMQMMVIFIMAVVMYIVLLASESYEVSTLIAYITAAAMLPKSVRDLASVYTTILMGIVAASALFDQLDEHDEIDDGDFCPKSVQGNLKVQNISFTYPGHEGQVLSDVSFEVNRGQTVAIVGRSGGGKSTLVNLIPRFYEASSGVISLDGVPITQWSLAALRGNISLVSQQVVLLNDTVLNNIAYGKLSKVSREQIIAAAKAAHAHEFIVDLPNGYDSQIGDDGVLLSGGQRQRLSIARAILANAPVLLLDEATAALDNESEKLIQEALIDFMRDKATVVIAHRLSTIENADLILVMDGGRVVESGTRDELLMMKGEFYKLSSQHSFDHSLV